MAINTIEDIRPEAYFAKRLFHLGEEIHCLGPAKIAVALYENNECFKLVHPKNRTYKYAINRKKDISSIARRVQDHFDLENAYDVPGKYMMAYSILFNCSMDYLYGRIETKCPNVEILDIGQKTGLSTKAVEQLMSNEVIYLDEFLQALDNYNFLDPLNYGTYDSELNDYFFDTEVSISAFWSKLIETELFTKLPENWYRMACSLYTSKAIKLIAEEAKKEWDNLPPLDNFLSWINIYETFHPYEPLYKKYNMSWEKIYENDPEYIKQIYREIRYNHLYSSLDQDEEYETTYWGCAGKFDRYALDFFHKKAETWCSSGVLPKIHFK